MSNPEPLMRLSDSELNELNNMVFDEQKRRANLRDLPPLSDQEAALVALGEPVKAMNLYRVRTGTNFHEMMKAFEPFRPFPAKIPDLPANYPDRPDELFPTIP